MSTCMKRPYESAASAKNALKSIRLHKRANRRGTVHRRESYTYQCWVCRKWHLASGN